MSTDREKLQHLLDNGKLIRHGDRTIRYLDDKGKLVAESKVNLFDTEMGSHISLGLYDLYTSTNWYDTLIDTSILCWAWDNEQDPKTIVLIKEYHETYYTSVDDIDYNNAIPVKEEDLDDFLYRV